MERIARLADGRLRNFRNGVLVGLPFRDIRLGQQRRQFIIGEPDDGHVKILGGKSRHLGPQQIIIPPGVERELVVGNDIGPLLGVRQMVQHDNGNLLEA